jgi:hypothetical protein
MTIEGTYISDTFQYIRIRLYPCRGQSCATESEIRDYFQNVDFNYFYRQTFYDLENKSNEISYFEESEECYLTIEPGLQKSSSIYVSKMQLK